jgi:hypothetical protein
VAVALAQWQWHQEWHQQWQWQWHQQWLWHQQWQWQWQWQWQCGSVAVAVAQSFSAQVIKKINFFKTTTHVFYIKNAFFLRLILIFRPFFAHFFTDLELFFAIL